MESDETGSEERREQPVAEMETAGEVDNTGQSDSDETIPLDPEELIDVDEMDSEPVQKQSEEGAAQQESEGTVQQAATDSGVAAASTKLLSLPLAKVKSIMKEDPEVHIVSRDAILLVAKATELFVQGLAKDCHKISVEDRKKAVRKQHVESCTARVDAYFFLEGTLD